MAGYTVYFLSGYYFKSFSLSPKSKTIIYLAAAVSFFITFYCTYYFSVSAEKDSYFYGYNLLNTMFITFAVFIFFKDKLGETTYQNRFFAQIVQLSFGVYLVHVLILTVLAQVGVNNTLINPLLMIPALAVFVFLLSLTAAFVISKIPLPAKII